MQSNAFINAQSLTLLDLVLKSGERRVPMIKIKTGEEMGLACICYFSRQMCKIKVYSELPTGFSMAQYDSELLNGKLPHIEREETEDGIYVSLHGTRIGPGHMIGSHTYFPLSSGFVSPKYFGDIVLCRGRLYLIGHTTPACSCHKKPRNYIAPPSDLAHCEITLVGNLPLTLDEWSEVDLLSLPESTSDWDSRKITIIKNQPSHSSIQGPGLKDPGFDLFEAGELRGQIKRINNFLVDTTIGHKYIYISPGCDPSVGEIVPPQTEGVEVLVNSYNVILPPKKSKRIQGKRVAFVETKKNPLTEGSESITDLEEMVFQRVGYKRGPIVRAWVTNNLSRLVKLHNPTWVANLAGDYPEIRLAVNEVLEKRRAKREHRQRHPRRIVLGQPIPTSDSEDDDL